MSNDWDFYSCLVDDEPASVFVDLGIRGDVPVRDRPYIAWIRVFMRAPRPDGLSSQEEFEELIRLEDHLTETAEEICAATYVGRNTSGGCRDFYFYVEDPVRWEQCVSTSMKSFSEYGHETGSRLDRDWATYLEFLYPSPEDVERIQNRRVCESLQRQGDALEEPREIDHWAHFPNENSLARFLSAIAPLGFEVRWMNRSDGGDRPFSVQFFRIDLPSFQRIDDVTLPLHRAAVAEGGDYDGWETEVITDSN